MCRMLAKVAVEPFSPAYELLDAPHSLRQQSKCGRQPDAPDTCGPHASGCGMAWVNGANLDIVKRGPDDRWDESFAAKVRSLRSRGVIAHNRLASPGLKIDRSSSHPFLADFRGTPAAFCHNGGIFNLMDEAVAQGMSDTQIFFSKLLASVPDLSHASIVATLRRFANEWTYTSLSGFLLTPDTLHVWRRYDPAHKRKEDFEKYYTLWVKDGGRSYCIASEPVDSNSAWQLIPNSTLVTYELAQQEVRVTSSGL